MQDFTNCNAATSSAPTPSVADLVKIAEALRMAQLPKQPIAVIIGRNHINKLQENLTHNTSKESSFHGIRVYIDEVNLDRFEAVREGEEYKIHLLLLRK